MAVQLIAHGNKIVDWVGEFAEDIKWAIFKVGVAKLIPWAGRVIASMETFMSPRGLIHSEAEKVRRAEAVPSARIGLNIRHVGHWNPSDDEHPGRRQASDTVPVFAVTADGQHMHFAMVTDREAGRARIKTGLGPGVETAANVASLHARGIPRPKFNAQHFDGGGLDVIGRSNIIGSQDEINYQPSVDDPGSFTALFDAFACYLNLGDGTGQASSDDIPGLW